MTIIIIVNKKYENVVKNWLCPNFLVAAPKKWGGCSPLAPPEKDKLFFKQLRSSS